MPKRKNEKVIKNAPKRANIRMEGKVFEEYYPAGQPYAKTKNGREKYAKNRNKDEFYLKDKHGQPIFAKKRNNAGDDEYIFAKNHDDEYIVASFKNIPLYPFDKDGKPIFPMEGKKQLYCKGEKRFQVYPEDLDTHLQIYARNENGDEYPARNLENKEYYAKKQDGEKTIEYLYEDKDNNKKYIKDGDRPIYPINITDEKPIYEKDDEENEIYMKIENVGEFYGRNQLGKEHYAKLKNGIEILATDKDEFAYYAKDDELNEFYPKDEQLNEYYKFRKNPMPMDVLAQRNNNEYFYAKKNTGDEFYPLKYLDEES